MTDFWKDSPAIEAQLGLVDARMRRTIQTPSFPLARAIDDLAGSNGKLLRPALLIIGSRFGAPASNDRIISLATALELLHVATLIHDDIIDEAPLRRGVRTLHTRFGPKEAVLAGDWLLSKSFGLASEGAVPENAQALGRLIGAICAAEIDQDLGRFGFATSVRHYLRRIAGKTAALFSLALHAGATEAKVPLETVQALRRAGYGIGMAFQVIDDILDFESSEGIMGKPVGRDVREGLCTLPLIYALKADASVFEPYIAKLKKRPTRAEKSIAAIVRLTNAHGGIAAARAMAKRLTARAEREIDRLPRVPARDELASLVGKLLDRTY